MPRKNARPAERKRREELKVKAEKLANFQRRARPILDRPRAGDGVLLAALAASVFHDH